MGGSGRDMRGLPMSWVSRGGLGVRGGGLGVSGGGLGVELQPGGGKRGDKEGPEAASHFSEMCRRPRRDGASATVGGRRGTR